MAGIVCPRCEAELTEGTAFCTRCGLRVDGPAPSADAPPAPVLLAPTASPAEVRFIACPRCGATNASSRRRCARCQDDLHADPPWPVSAGSGEPAPRVDEDVEHDGEPPEASPGSPAVFAIVVSIAGLAILGVILTILSASGVGIFDRGAAVEEDPAEVTVAIASVRASSVLPASAEDDHDPRNLLDEDPSTVWRADASGEGVGEWVELGLEGTTQISRLLLWNGDQRAGRFRVSPRASRVRIDLDDRTFEADLLDVDGPQAIDLPETVAASSVRVTILELIAGEGNVVLSDVEVRGPLPLRADPDGADADS